MDPYKHYFSGKCDPKNGLSGKTFSVGIWQAQPRANGKGCKRGPVKVRVKGLCNRPDMVYSRAEMVCRDLDIGNHVSAKTISVISWIKSSLF